MKRKRLLSQLALLCAMTLLLCSCAGWGPREHTVDTLFRSDSDVDSGEPVSVPESDPPPTTTRRTTTTTSRTTTTTTAPPTSTTTKPTTTTTTERPTTTTTTRRDPVTTVPPAVMTLAKAAYPEMPQYVRYGEKGYKAWQKDRTERWKLLKDGDVDLSAFYAATMEAFLSEENGENKVYSPLNMYIGLSLLTEITAGDSRAQLLDLLGVKKLSTLRSRNNTVWNGLYRDDGAVTCRLANSMWLADDVTYKQAPLDNLAKHYYASAFAGEMGSPDYNAALQDWLNEQTDGLLKKQVAQEELRDDTVLALASTICFSAKWFESFKEEDTVKGKFKTPDGRVKVNYMCRTEIHEPLYAGDCFTAFAKVLDDHYEGYRMWLVLPHEGVTPEELSGDVQLQKLLSTGAGVPEYGEAPHSRVNLQVPKFDVSARMDMVEELEKLGVTDILSRQKADFSPLMDEKPLWLDEMHHAARVKIDEEGCEAAAYTVSQMKASANSGAVVDFTLDRPFLFAVTGVGNTMLFAGIVNEP